MSDPNHYKTLQISNKASQREIKNAYRRLAKRFHPDSQGEKANHEQIVQLNAAYEVLKDSQLRRCYDLELLSGNYSHKREKRSSKASSEYQRQRQTEREAEALEQKWLIKVYQPIKKLIEVIIQPLEIEIEALSADPFDDELMSDFQIYIDNSLKSLKRAYQVFTSLPNPSKFASVAPTIFLDICGHMSRNLLPR